MALRGEGNNNINRPHCSKSKLNGLLQPMLFSLAPIATPAQRQLIRQLLI